MPLKGKRLIRGRANDLLRCLVLVGAGATLLLAACEKRAVPDTANMPALPTATSLGEQSIEAVADYLAAAPYATASQALGDRLLLQCRACHTFAKGAGHTLGPNLFDVFGRKAGSASGYGFTRALQDAEFVWTPRALDAWLAQPQKFLPGNAMAYGGLRFPDDRAALIASLMRQTTDLAPTSATKNEN